VASLTPVLITATLAGSSPQTVTFTGTIPSLTSLVLSPKIGREDDQITGRVTLNHNSIGVTTVNPVSSDSAIVPNTTMTVADGSNFGDFSFRIGAAGVEKTVTITATLAGSANVQDTLAVQTYTVFVTSVGHDAAFGGLAGADAFCQARANIGIANGTLRSGNYVAFLSSASLCNGVRSLYCFEAPPNPLVVFTTSAATHHNGNFGGLAGADAFCQARADAGVTHGIPRGTYQAILSSSIVNAKDRLTTEGEFVLPDGSLVAANLTSLFSGSIQHAFNQDELGNTGLGGPYSGSFTGSLSDGTHRGTMQCSDWTSSSSGVFAGYGQVSVTNGTWLNEGMGGIGCDQPLSLYCAQQDLPRKTVFVTSLASQHDGSFGGLAGADAFCQARALAGAAHGIPQGKTWRAFLSGNSIHAKDRARDGRYVLPSGTLVATGKPDLLDNSLQHPIDEDELGNQNVDALVYSGTATDGTTFGGDHCSEWTSTSGYGGGQPGRSSSATIDWLVYGALSPTCGSALSVYCFQQ
jgi:hypothetical protein